ncbi:hypothetical protein [Treponema vincentii]|uniref:hypothetical protein n=1 Tax=Treponema vincentii TaxID=69710 RepID=UPI003F50F3B0
MLVILRAALTNTPNLDLIALNATQKKNDDTAAAETNDSTDDMLTLSSLRSRPTASMPQF